MYMYAVERKRTGAHTRTGAGSMWHAILASTVWYRTSTCCCVVVLGTALLNQMVGPTGLSEDKYGRWILGSSPVFPRPVTFSDVLSVISATSTHGVGTRS